MQHEVRVQSYFSPYEYPVSSKPFIRENILSSVQYSWHLCELEMHEFISGFPMLFLWLPVSVQHWGLNPERLPTELRPYSERLVCDSLSK